MGNFFQKYGKFITTVILIGVWLFIIGNNIYKIGYLDAHLDLLKSGLTPSEKLSCGSTLKY